MVLTAVSGLVTGCGHKLPSVADSAGPRSALSKPSLYAPHSASSPDPASTLSLCCVWNCLLHRLSRAVWLLGASQAATDVFIPSPPHCPVTSIYVIQPSESCYSLMSPKDLGRPLFWSHCIFHESLISVVIWSFPSFTVETHAAEESLRVFALGGELVLSSKGRPF